jgi:flagellar biosynthesis protein FlhA
VECSVVKKDYGEFFLAAGFFWILALLVVPLPTILLDLFLALSITAGLLILLLALYTKRPLDFSVFPSLLLMITLLRLGLNVASTRLILLHGSEGPDAAGTVIAAFGDFTIGGNYAVGVVIFLIFVVINFTVITKGSGRIAEVAARFTLDAMPGKQMAIDADLNQGVIDDAEASQRRMDVQREADFYGAMDGASKFVRGDAIAGMLITGVNIVGGFVIGIFQEGMGLLDALETYTILTVGDGLVSQIPALIVSTAAGVVVSRAGAGAPLVDELRAQIFHQPRAMGIVASMLGILAVVPGLPFFPFAMLAAGTGYLSFSQKTTKEDEVEAPELEVEPVSEEAEVVSALTLDELELEIGYGIIPLVDEARGGELLGRIKATRRQLALELGFVVPLIHIRDNLQLDPNAYSILIRGNGVAGGEMPSGRWLAIQSDEGVSKVPGIKTKDPAFGLPALWIQERDRERASSAGYAVVDAATSLATHLAEVIRSHAASLLSRQHVRELLDEYAKRAPNVVEEIIPSIVSISVLHRTLRSLLLERVSIRDIGTILETLAEFGGRVQDADLLTDLVRERLGRTITKPYVDRDGTLKVITLSPELEEQLRAGINRTESGSFLSVDPKTLEGLVAGIESAVTTAGGLVEGAGPVLLSSQAVRSPLRQLVSRIAPRLAVLSHNELPADVRIVAHDTVRLADAH